MRQIADTLVWLGVISLVAAVIYFTPRLASYVGAATASTENGSRVTWQQVASETEEIADQLR
jgi:hypothetical protein